MHKGLEILSCCIQKQSWDHGRILAILHSLVWEQLLTVVKRMCRSASWYLQIRQYHLQGEAVSQEYVLGVFAANVSDIDAIQQETGPTGIPKAYVYQVSPPPPPSLVALPSSIICLPILASRLLQMCHCVEADLQRHAMWL